MKRLHERTRRLVCRTAFIALCLVPTTAVLAWSVVRNLPGHTAAEAAALRAATGLDVKLGRVKHPRPDVVLYEDAELVDPETGVLLLRCRVVEASTQDTATRVHASQVEITAEGTSRVWQLLQRHLQRGTQRPDAQFYLSVSEATWHGVSGAQTVNDFTGRIGPTTQGIEADFRFRLAGQEQGDLAAVRVERKLRDGLPTTHVQFNTGGARFPARMLAPFIPVDQWLGGQALFDGFLSMEERAGAWTGDLQGHLVRIDLDTLVSQRFPHTLSGLADVAIRKAIVADNRLIEADGSVRCGAGMIGRSLLAAGMEHLGMRSDAKLSATATTAPMKQLAFTFVLTRRGLQLFGECEGPSGTIVLGDSGVLWQQPSFEPQPIAHLIRALAPASDVQVPASHESQWLIDVLPVPQLVPPRTGDQPPQPHLRVKGTNAR